MAGDPGCRSWRGFAQCRAEVQRASPSPLCSLLSAACAPADICFYSCFHEFLPYLHLSDLFENSCSFRVKNPPWSRLKFHPVRRESPPQTRLPNNTQISTFKLGNNLGKNDYYTYFICEKIRVIEKIDKLLKVTLGESGGVRVRARKPGWRTLPRH